MKLSIIVPVYNVQDFLRDCLDSLLEQNLNQSEYEIICINDGSKDTSLQILNEYAPNYKNIVVIDKANAGVSAARNDGLEIAKGDYVAFCDSDDCIRTGAFGWLMDFIDTNSVDVAIMPNFVRVAEEYSYEKEAINDFDVEILPDANYSARNVCSLIVKKSIIDDRNIRFKKGMAYGEDTLFAAWIYAEGMKKNSNIALVNTPLYLYRERQGSAMGKANLDAHFNDMYAMATEYLLMKDATINDVLLKNLEARIGGAVSTVLFDNLRIKKYKPKELFEKLVADGLYPYKIPFWTLHNRSIKINLLNAFKCSLIIKPLYSIFYKIVK